MHDMRELERYVSENLFLMFTSCQREGRVPEAGTG